MEQDKKKILSDLYAIRATMSLIAENDDNADPERKAIADLAQGQRDAQKALSDSEKTLGSVFYQKKKSAKQRMEELRKVQVEKQYDYESFKKQVNCSFTSYFWNFECPFALILAILIFASVALSFALGHIWSCITWGYDYENWTAYFLGVLATGAICLPIVCGYFFGICIPVTLHARNRDRYEMGKRYVESQQADRELNVATEIYEAFDERIGDVAYSWQTPVYKKITSPKHHCAEVNELIQAHEKELSELEKKKETLEKQKNPHNKAIQAIAKKSQAIIDIATKAYPLIDFRDWENVDLLIYYFETGRADDMKEALQLVDRQRQTEMLAEAIAMASAEICKTIHHSMNQLGNALAQSFSLLSSQMAQQHAEMLKEMEEQTAAQQAASEAQLKEIRAQTAAQVTSQAMNRALLEKISESSSDLAYQMNRQMREVHGIPV